VQESLVEVIAKQKEEDKIAEAHQHEEVAEVDMGRFWFDIFLSEAPWFILAILAAFGSSMATIALPGRRMILVITNFLRRCW
jgi:hypothetical protein